MKKYSLLVLTVLVWGCNLDEFSRVTADKGSVFGSVEAMTAYTMSFYEMLPDATAQIMSENSLIDYGATRDISGYTFLNTISESTATGWGETSDGNSNSALRSMAWSRLRNVNYFITNCTDQSVPEDVRNNFIGLARFFRAWFYYEKVTLFGDVPYIDRLLGLQDDNILYGHRDSRELVMEKVWEDLMFAAENITRTTDATQSSLVTKWAAYVMASRISLFEGTFRKYHNLNLETSWQTWLERAEWAASQVMQNSGKGLHGNYRELFTSVVPPVRETILAIAASPDFSTTFHQANWRWNSTTYAQATSLIRPFICTYLQKDGTPYTNRPDWEREVFYQEFQNRDNRLSATVRYPGYTREGQIALPVFEHNGRTGYQPMKLCVDATNGDNQTQSSHSIQLMRYAEVLLNYAEAKAELGTLTDSDWEKTIGALRSRAGITGGLTAKPTVVDNYLKNTYFPEISDPVILEIRRERAIELILEGFRLNDLRRWKKGDLFVNEWTGMFIPDVNIPLDVDNNGSYDVIYYTDAAGLAVARAMLPDRVVVQEVKVTDNITTASEVNTIQIIPVAGGGYHLAWMMHNNYRKVWGQKQYLYPIPISALNRNPNLVQNSGWENGALNDGN